MFISVIIGCGVFLTLYLVINCKITIHQLYFLVSLIVYGSIVYAEKNMENHWKKLCRNTFCLHIHHSGDCLVIFEGLDLEIYVISPLING